MFRTRGFIFRYSIVSCIDQYRMYNALEHAGIHNRLPEDEPSDSKHVEDIKN